uniref:Secreted protein n=1 Tax=Caenorhabditis tropicalis TaxID=1561998 RepID=A0A1I7URJ4_9PELO
MNDRQFRCLRILRCLRLSIDSTASFVCVSPLSSHIPPSLASEMAVASSPSHYSVSSLQTAVFSTSQPK